MQTTKSIVPTKQNMTQKSNFNFYKLTNGYPNKKKPVVREKSDYATIGISLSTTVKQVTHRTTAALNW